jgi:tetratricopeptide (TPR) repeat protein
MYDDAERDCVPMMENRIHLRPHARFVPIILALAFMGGWSGLSASPNNSLRVTAVEPKAAVTTPGAEVWIHGGGFSSDVVAYVGGIQVRITNLVNSSTLVVVTPYLRPGTYQIQLKSAVTTLRSDLSFTALPAPMDAEIDDAVALAGKGQASAGIDILTGIAKTASDYQVRAFAHYQIGQIYFAQGDWWRWAGQSNEAFMDSDKSGSAVQTNWRYRVASDLGDYFLPTSGQQDHDLALADFTVAYDVTENPEPRFYRGLLNARYGNFAKARADLDFVLAVEPGNPSYRALAAYISALEGGKVQLQTFSGETIEDARALGLLGEVAYLNGDTALAEQWWAQATKIYPLGANLACLAGKKHLERGQARVAASLLTECTSMTPNGREAEEARQLLNSLPPPPR